MSSDQKTEEKGLVTSCNLNEFNKYQTAIDEAVQMMQMQSPDSYYKAQLIGSDVIACDYELKVGIDYRGREIQAKLIHRCIVNDGFILSDFSEEEQTIYKEFYSYEDNITEQPLLVNKNDNKSEN